jgi:hypothetical protein
MPGLPVSPYRGQRVAAALDQRDAIALQERRDVLVPALDDLVQLVRERLVAFADAPRDRELKGERPSAPMSKASPTPRRTLLRRRIFPPPAGTRRKPAAGCRRACRPAGPGSRRRSPDRRCAPRIDLHRRDRARPAADAREDSDVLPAICTPIGGCGRANPSDTVALWLPRTTACSPLRALAARTLGLPTGAWRSGSVSG